MSQTIKVGVFGAGRGEPYIDLISREDPDVIRVVAVCDKRADRLENMKKYEGLPRFSDFESFLEYGKKAGMNAVFLANFFHQHTPYAIRAMENGMDVVSECTAASTLKECVELCRAVERTERKYILAENYPFMTPNLLMKKLIDQGTLGTPLYAEGEYNHSGTLAELRELTP
ncbi:MAG: Gfo/Idh/MocA family oxidoreductase, partial [Clostridia bacterium]|nr:Gfo/Idh/MocA family oxidoreductase [Clostridia bacterium]